MKRLILLAGIATLVAVGQLQAQHVVFVHDFYFRDSVSQNTTTTITLGTTIRWQLVSGFHTVTSGSGTSDPNYGSIFGSPVDPGTPFYEFTPTTVGPIPYFCFPHAQFGMYGNIVVLPPPPPLYPGTGEDLDLGTGVNQNATFGGGQDVKNASAGDWLLIEIQSGLGHFEGDPLLVGVEVFTTGTAIPVGPIPEIHLSAGGAILLVGEGAAGLQNALSPGGDQFVFLVPAGLTGVSLMIQALTISPGTAANGAIAISDAHELRIS